MTMFFKKEVSIPAKSSSEIPADHDLSQSTKLKDAIQVELTAPEEKKGFRNQLGNLNVGEGVRLRGSFNVPNKTIVAGLIEGNLATKELLVQENGKVQGQVDCQLADIAGYLENDLQVHTALTLRASAVITGNVFYQEITIEKGAKITGKLARL
jgi:cytoskeletal protein CcmA (bactofilin family)